MRLFRARGVSGDERKIDLRLHQRRELYLRPFSRLTKSLQRHAVLLKIDSLVALKLLADPVNYDLVEVVTPEVGITVRGLDFEDAVA